MATMEKFEDSEAWKTSRELCRIIYRLTRRGDFSRDFGLSNQIQRASVSVMSNIAEGFESRTDAIFVDLLGRAKASSGEVRSQAYVALDIGYISEDEFQSITQCAMRCSRLITGLMTYLSRSSGSHRFKEERSTYIIECPE